MQGYEPPVRGRILIVEDNELNLKLLNDILEYQGYETIVARNGADAASLAHQLHPDVILLDIQLPDVAGTEVAHQLKTDEQTKSIPIVAITAFAMPGDRDRCLASGCADYISKPYNIQTVLGRIERYVGQTRSEPSGSTPPR
jgi:two-component system, cell cycle response regulator DivK